MRRLLLPALLAAAAAALLLRSRRAPPPVPPPPPPAMKAAGPLSFISEAELGKVRASLEDSDPQIRWAAAKLLYELGDPQAPRLLEKRIAIDPDAALRERIVKLLRDRPGPARLAALVAGLRDTDMAVRVASLEALGEAGDPSVSVWVTGLLQDSEPEVRLAALKALERLQEKRAEAFRELAEKLRRDYEAALRRARQRQSE